MCLCLKSVCVFGYLVCLIAHQVIVFARICVSVSLCVLVTCSILDHIWNLCVGISDCVLSRLFGEKQTNCRLHCEGFNSNAIKIYIYIHTRSIVYFVFNSCFVAVVVLFCFFFRRSFANYHIQEGFFSHILCAYTIPSSWTYDWRVYTMHYRYNSNMYFSRWYVQMSFYLFFML